MEKKFKVVDMATVLGVVPKTIYKMIERNELRTVTERVNNRQTTLIVTNDEEIAELRKNQSKEPVKTGNYYNNVTVSEQLRIDNISNEQVNNNAVTDLTHTLLDEITKEKDRLTNQLSKVNEELITYKSKQLLLEDKEKREGLFINEINELKCGSEQLRKDNEQLRIRNERLLSILIGVVIALVTVIISLFVVFANVTKNGTETEETSATAPNQIEQTSTISKKEITTKKR